MASARRIPALDGLRGLAISLVLIWHCSEFYKPVAGSFGAAVMSLFQTTWSGVDLFFVLSGFLIGGILIDNRDAENLWRVFYIRRTLRILPLYSAVLISFVVLLSAASTLPWLMSNALPLWSYATFTQNLGMGWDSIFGANYLGPTWSLAVEEQFYLVMPFVVRFAPTRFLALFLGALVALSVAGRIAIYHWGSARHYLAVYVLMPCRADALLLGALCAIFYRSSGWTFIQSHVVLRRTMVAGLFVLVVALSASSGSLYSREMIFGGYTVLAMFYSAILLSALLETKGPLAWIAAQPRLQQLGGIAFGVYLIHIPALGLIHYAIRGAAPSIATPEDLAVTLLGVAATIVIANFSWHVLERRAIVLGHKISFRRQLPTMSTVPSGSFVAAED